MKIVLRDGAPRSDAHASVNVSKNGNTLEISASSGTSAAHPPAIIEFYRGKVTLRAYRPDGKVVSEHELPVDPITPAEPATNPDAGSHASNAEAELAAFDAAELAAFDAA